MMEAGGYFLCIVSTHKTFLQKIQNKSFCVCNGSEVTWNLRSVNESNWYMYYGQTASLSVREMQQGIDLLLFLLLFFFRFLRN